MFLLSAQNNFYIILSSYVEGYVKKFKSEFHVFGWFLGLKNLDVFRKPFCGASLEIIFKQKQFHRASFFLFLFFFLDFLMVFHMVWKNQRSWELWLDGFWGNRHLKIKKISAKIFFAFLSRHYGFTNCCEMLNFLFSNIITRGVASACKILTFYD